MRTWLLVGCVLAWCAVAKAATSTIVSDGFESYNLGVLDKDQATSANPAPNGSGNAWWGPGTPNFTVVGTDNGVTPHSGTQMIRGNNNSTTHSLEWNNIAYRSNGGVPFSGNLQYDFWFYDPNGATGGGAYEGNSAIAFYQDAPSDTDYPAAGTLSGSTIIDRLTLGAANFKSHTAGFPQTYDPTLYQARIVNAPGGYNNVGWFNTTVTRTIGWHHGMITVGPADTNGSNLVSFYIDNLITPTLTGTTSIDQGYNTLEFTSEGTAIGYFDDANLVSVPEPAALWLLAALPLLLRRHQRA